MGCDTISYGGAYLGFEINSRYVCDTGDDDEFLNFDKCSNMEREIDYKLYSFLSKKFGKSVPEEFSKMKFHFGHCGLDATYEATSYECPTIIYGYDLDDIISRQKQTDLNSIEEINLPRTFPKNCLDILSEFFAEYKLKQDRKNSSDSDSSEESDNEELPESELKKCKEYIAEQINFGLHGFVC